MAKRRQEPWMAYVKAGDVLQTPSGDLRVVRKVRRFSDGDLSSATFAIRRCSWTSRAYTVKGFTDLMGWYFVLSRELPDDKISKKLAHDLRYSKRFDPKLTCCDVGGIG